MGFIKLPSNSEKILLELAQAENPTQALNAHYEVCSIRERSVLDGIVRERKSSIMRTMLKKIAPPNGGV